MFDFVVFYRSAYETSLFCETFHLDQSGWRECYLCNKVWFLKKLILFLVFVFFGLIEIFCNDRDFIVDALPLSSLWSLWTSVVLVVLPVLTAINPTW